MLVCESVGKTDDLLMDHFVSKQSREAVDLPLICHSSLIVLPLTRNDLIVILNLSVLFCKIRIYFDR